MSTSENQIVVYRPNETVRLGVPMRKLIATALAVTVVTAFAVPSGNTYHAVTNDWYNANFGLSVEAQLMAQRILAPLLLVALVVLPVVIVLIKPVCQARGRTIADGQCASPTPSYPSSAFSNFAEAFVCPKSRFPTAEIFYDLRSLDKMVVNSTTCDNRAKSLAV